MTPAPMKVVLASQNQGKLKEFSDLLGEAGLSVKSQAEFDVPSAEETGSTFVENALIKARAVSQATGLAALGDDSGLVVPALNGAPGIYSARYAGEHGNDDANNQKLVRELKGIDNRRAFFYCAIVLLRHADDPTPLIATAAWHGQIVDQPAGSGGFGYDPHFWLPEFNCTSAELVKAKKNAMSHRGQATTVLLTQLLADV